MAKFLMFLFVSIYFNICFASGYVEGGKLVVYDTNGYIATYDIQTGIQTQPSHRFSIWEITEWRGVGNAGPSVCSADRGCGYLIEFVNKDILVKYHDNSRMTWEFSIVPNVSIGKPLEVGAD